MRHGRRLRFLLVIFVVYITVCTVGGIYLADGSLHPGRRALGEEEVATFTGTVRSMHVEFEDVAIKTSDDVILRGWLLRPAHREGDAVIVLHGWADDV